MFKFLKKWAAVSPSPPPPSTVEPMSTSEDRARAGQAARRTTRLVLAQLGLATTPACAMQDDAWCLGYLFGSYDAALRRATADDISSIVELKSGFEELFAQGSAAGIEALTRCLNLRRVNDGMFREGEAAGRSEMNAFLEARSVLSPMGLFKRLQAKPLPRGLQ